MAPLKAASIPFGVYSPAIMSMPWLTHSKVWDPLCSEIYLNNNPLNKSALVHYWLQRTDIACQLTPLKCGCVGMCWLLLRSALAVSSPSRVSIELGNTYLKKGCPIGCSFILFSKLANMYLLVFGLLTPSIKVRRTWEVPEIRGGATL